MKRPVIRPAQFPLYDSASVMPARHEKLPKFDMVYLWKRRCVMAPSAPQTEKEEHLYVLWNRPDKGPDRPTKRTLDDPILSSVWIMKTGWCYAVGTSEKGFMGAHVADVIVFMEKNGALDEYKRRSKMFRRSKEIDYGFPLDTIEPSEMERADGLADKRTEV